MADNAPLPAPLASALERLTESVSASRARQLRWVAGELALAGPSLPGLRPTMGATWFSPEAVDDYLRRADAGLLRRRGETAQPGTAATQRVRRVCLRMLAQAAGHPLPELPLPTAPLPREHADPAAVAAAATFLQARADRLRSASAARAAAVTALVRDTGLRVGELAALQVDDIDVEARTVRYRPRPQAGRSPEPPRTVKISPSTTEAVARWLESRTLLTELVPRSRALFVSVAGNHDGHGTRRPAGLPLRPRGLTRAHARTVGQVNALLAGEPGHEPLPRTLGPWRPQRRAEPGDG